MKKASKVFLMFAAVVFILQWLVPATMIIGQEMVLDKGDEIKIRCRPIDPYDPFRGRYVRVRLDFQLPESMQLPEEFYKQQRVFALLDKDEDGFVTVNQIVKDAPEQGLYVRGNKFRRRNTFELGLDRYYMNERLAPEAERLVRSGIREDSDVWATLKVWNGKAVMNGLFVDGIPIEVILVIPFQAEALESTGILGEKEQPVMGPQPDAPVGIDTKGTDANGTPGREGGIGVVGKGFLTWIE